MVWLGYYTASRLSTLLSCGINSPPSKMKAILMNTLDILTTRRSTKSLTTPAPNTDQLHRIIKAAMQVPDHGYLTPWRFVAIQSEEGKAKFAQLLKDTVTQLNMGEKSMEKAERVGNMAPLIIAVISHPKTTPPIKPEWEQFLSAGCAAYSLQIAAKAEGYDSVWITGLWVNSPLLRQAFSCEEADKIIGLIMIGTASCDHPAKAKNEDVAAYTTYW